MVTKVRKLLAPALLLTCMAAAFRFDAGGVHWFWSAQPAVAVVLALGAATAWGLLLWSLRGHAQPHA